LFSNDIYETSLFLNVERRPFDIPESLVGEDEPSFIFIATMVMLTILYIANLFLFGLDLVAFYEIYPEDPLFISIAVLFILLPFPILIYYFFQGIKLLLPGK
jgi:hypothetical protein